MEGAEAINRSETERNAEVLICKFS